jgi:hypothetical protein
MIYVAEVACAILVVVVGKLWAKRIAAGKKNGHPSAKAA